MTATATGFQLSQEQQYGRRRQPDSSFRGNDGNGDVMITRPTYPGVLTLGGSCPPPRARRRRTVSIRT